MTSHMTSTALLKTVQGKRSQIYDKREYLHKEVISVTTQNEERGK